MDPQFIVTMKDGTTHKAGFLSSIGGKVIAVAHDYSTPQYLDPSEVEKIEILVAAQPPAVEVPVVEA